MRGNSRAKRVSPTYPTRAALMAEPGALQRNVPAGWKRIVAGGGVAAVFTVAGLTALPAGCTRDTSGPATIVAPIFEHGDGRAATGCVVISPPVFITEEEARKIITEELGKAGVKFTQHDVKMAGIKVRAAKVSLWLEDGKPENIKGRGEPNALVADLVDPEKGVAVEYISREDYNQHVDAEMMSTAQDYDLKAVGRDLAEQIKAGKAKERFGVFYDPAGHWVVKLPTEEELKGKNAEERSKMYDEMREAGPAGATKAAKENLRLQVRDFAEWLKKQGVI